MAGPRTIGPRTVLERRLPLAWIVAWRYVRGERSQVLSSTALAAFSPPPWG